MIARNASSNSARAAHAVRELLSTSTSTQAAFPSALSSARSGRLARLASLLAEQQQKAELEETLALMEDGKLVIHAGLYHAFVQGTESIANNLAMAQDDVQIVCPAMGGNFGSRGDTLHAAVAGLLTQKTGHPVRIVYSRAESILGSCKAPSVNMRYKTGATKDGLGWLPR